LSKGKALAIARVAPPSHSEEEDVFVLARKIEEILAGKSNRTCHKVMNMVGSLHGLRTIPMDRPIGQSTAGTTKVVAQTKKSGKGKCQQASPAAWKQTAAYKQLSAQREQIVSAIKALPATSLQKEEKVEALRLVERQLKELKGVSAGN
jgi:hypothetical protein